MSLIFVNHFIYESTSYTTYYDTVANSGIVDISGPSPLADVPFPIDGFDDEPGTLIATFCSDNPDTTKVRAFLATHTPFFTTTLEADSADCPVVPPDTCDLEITSLTVVNEQSTGSNDGRVTINASTSHGPIQYSLDGSTWVTTSLFTSLSPGNYTALVKDANDCTASLPFAILAFNNPVQNFEDDLPTQAVSPSNISKWNAAFNPIVVKFQRKDFNVVSVTRLSDTQILVELDTTLTFTQFQLAINDIMYFKTASYDFLGRADAHTTSGPHSILTITEVYTVDDTVGYMNINGIKPGYYVECQIQYGLDPVHPQLINPQFSPSQKGATRADLAPFLETLLDFKDNYNYTDASFSDTSISQSYQLSYREVWTGGNGLWFKAPYPLYVVRAAMQLGEPNNGNMAKFVPFQAVTNASDKALFLTNFKSPIYWQGLPFEMSFIYSEDLIDKALAVELTPDCGGAVDGFLLNADAGHILDTDTGRFIIARSNISGIDVLAALGVNRVLIPDSFDCCATQIKVNIYYLQDSVKVYVMQDLIIRTECPCDEPYVYIKWVNSYGGWDYYRFGFNQFLNANISNDQAVKRFVTNWTTDDTIEEVINKSSIRSLKVGANNIPQDDANALQWARKSVKAMMLTNTNPVTWQTVIIKDGSTDTIQTRKKRSDVNFELLLVSDNIQIQ